MPDLIVALRQRIDVNAPRAVDAYQREVPEYASPAPEQLTHMLDFARFIRRVSLERVRDDTPLDEDDLAAIGNVGRRRGEDRLSLASQRQALSTHTALMLRDVVETASSAASPMPNTRRLSIFRSYESFPRSGRGMRNMVRNYSAKGVPASS
ncbi:hypothetical protein ACWER9_09930 [Micromonospora sp. NPDC003944]